MIKIIKYLIILLLPLLLTNCKSYLKTRIFPVPDDVSIPKISDSILIEAKNEDRIVKGLYIKNSEKIIIIFHGNGSTINNEIKAADIFIKNKFSVLLVEFPGYGISKKFQVSEKNIYSDSEKLINNIKKEYNFLNDNIILFGRSLGAGVAVEMAKRNYGSKLILITPFTSIIDMTLGSLTKDFAEKNIEDKFDNFNKAKNIDIPTLILHGKNDELVPYDMSKKLLKEFKNGKLITLDTKEHRYIYDVISDEIWNSLIEFINK